MKACFKVLSVSLAAALAASLSACASSDSSGSAGASSEGYAASAQAAPSLPKKPTKAQAKAYVQKTMALANASKQEQRPGDQPVKDLQKVGQENLDVLIDALSNSPSKDYYLVCAISKLSDSGSKRLVVSSLPRKHYLASVVYVKGWESDAAPALLSGLRNANEYLPYDWLRAAAKLDAPASKKLLKSHFIKHPYCAAYDVLEKAKIKLEPAELDMAFANLRAIDKGFDLKFAKAGSKLALEHVLFVYQHANMACPQSVMKLASYEGAPAKFQAWFDANKAKLAYDKDKGVFALPSAKKS